MTEAQDTAPETSSNIHPSWNTPGGRAQIEPALEAMRKALRGKYVDVDDFVSTAALKLMTESPRASADETKKRARALALSVAASGVRTEKRRREKLTDAPRLPPAEDVDPEALAQLKRGEADSPALRQLAGAESPTTDKINFVLKELRKVKPTELEPRNLEKQLGDLATLSYIAAIQSTNERIRRVAAVLIALSESGCDRELELVARGYLGDHRGPESRPEQVESLIAAVRSRSAVAIVNRLQISPRLVVDTMVPPSGTPWPEGVREATIARVQATLDASIGKTAENTTRAVLRALGCPPAKAKAFDNHLQKGKSRKKAKETSPAKG